MRERGWPFWAPPHGFYKRVSLSTRKPWRPTLAIRGGTAVCRQLAEKKLMPENSRSYLRPGAVNRSFGNALAFLVRIGLIRSHFYVLEVRGRKSGKTISLPVNPLDLEGTRYLVCARGESNWVRNARTAGEVVLARAMRRRRYAVQDAAMRSEMRRPTRVRARTAPLALVHRERATVPSRRRVPDSELRFPQ